MPRSVPLAKVKVILQNKIGKIAFLDTTWDIVLIFSKSQCLNTCL